MVVSKNRSTSKTVISILETIHLSDPSGRFAMLENLLQGTDSYAANLTRYIYSNHIGSASLELDDNASIISYEEYHPYGTTAYTAGNASIKACNKRYKFVGKEKDEESGLYYMNARYYAPWLCRWVSTDPILSNCYNLETGKPQRNAERHFLELTASGYEYCFDNPVRFVDESGEQVVNEKLKSIPLEPLTVRAKKSLAKSFFKGLAKGLGTAILVAAVVTIAAVAFPVVATFLAAASTVLIVAGAAVTAYGAIQSFRGRDYLNKKISKNAAAEQLGETLGGVIPISRLGKLGKLKNVFRGKTKSINAEAEPINTNSIDDIRVAPDKINTNESKIKTNEIDESKEILETTTIPTTAILNSKGVAYPEVFVEGYGKVPFPSGQIKKITPSPPDLRAAYNKIRNSGEFKEWWIAQGRPWPTATPGSQIEIHHIQPLGHGGNNSFDNLVPLDFKTQHKFFNSWWLGY